MSSDTTKSSCTTTVVAGSKENADAGDVSSTAAKASSSLPRHRRPLDADFTEKLIAYCKGNLKVLPGQMTVLDTNRLSIVFFSVSALDLLGKLDEALGDKKKRSVIDWIYALQVLPKDVSEEETPKRAKNWDHWKQAGFIGGTFLGTPFNSDKYSRYCADCAALNHGHVAMTYFALSTLAILGDNFERVNRDAIVSGMRSLQRADGSFAATAFGSEAGMRFLYCACAVSYMLNDWSAVDVDGAVGYVASCRTYDGGAMGLVPGQESHGGSTYCAVGALSLMGRLDDILGGKLGRDELVRWCVHRQVSGFQGRRNKVPDTCYSFWVGATLSMLDAFDLVDFDFCRMFHDTCKSPFGGFLKTPTHGYPDPLHTYFSVCAMSMMRVSGFRKLHPALCISQRAADSGVWNRKKELRDDDNTNDSDAVTKEGGESGA